MILGFRVRGIPYKPTVPEGSSSNYPGVYVLHHKHLGLEKEAPIAS
jgi:hypothetical protein